jgi:hypothetical protein
MAAHTHAVLIERAAGWDDARGLRDQDGWDVHAADDPLDGRAARDTAAG